MSNLPAADVIQIGLKRRLRVVGCQGDSPTMGALKASVRVLHPGIDPALLRKQALARKARGARDKIAEGFCELVEATSIEEAHAWLHRLLDGDKGRAL